ncbi:hypothetical protein [Methanosarcina horonobensis]
MKISSRSMLSMNLCRLVSLLILALPAGLSWTLPRFAATTMRTG